MSHGGEEREKSDSAGAKAQRAQPFFGLEKRVSSGETITKGAMQK